MNSSGRELWLIIFSFFIIYFVWGSTYLANAWGVRAIPPFLFAGARFLLAGLLLLAIARVFEPISITTVQLKNAAKAGVLLFAFGNGLLVWALQFVDSGITALIVAFQPLIVALMLWTLKNQRPGWRTWVGIGLGLVGMGLLVGQPQFLSSWEWIMGVLAVVIALFAWGYMSIWIPSADLPSSIIQSAAFQMVFGGMASFLIGGLLGEFRILDFQSVPTRVVWAYSYLVLFGSILAFSAFNYLLRKVSPTKVVSSALVNPVVALFLGWWLNQENLTGQSIVAAALLLSGVFFINWARAKKVTPVSPPAKQ